MKDELSALLRQSRDVEPPADLRARIMAQVDLSSQEPVFFLSSAPAGSDTAAVVRRAKSLLTYAEFTGTVRPRSHVGEETRRICTGLPEFA